MKGYTKLNLRLATRRRKKKKKKNHTALGFLDFLYYRFGHEWLGNLCKALRGRNTDPRVSHIFSRRFLKQNYPKYISDVLPKILEKKEHNYQMFCVNL